MKKERLDRIPFPPEWADRFLSWYCSDRFLEEIQGDLYELFEDTYFSRGKRAANWQFIFLVFRFLRPFRIKRLEEWETPQLRIDMLFHYLKTAYRNLLRFRGFSLLNILGLAIGMAACLLILRYVVLEYSYDQFHAKAKDIHRVHYKAFNEGNWSDEGIYSSYGLGPKFQDELPQVKAYARLLPWYNAAVLGVELPNGNQVNHFEENGIFADAALLEIFDFPFIEGNPQTALKDMGSVVISEKIAQKYFGTTAGHIGKNIQFNGIGLDKPLTIKGVMKDLPVNTHLEFDFVVNMSDALASEQYTEDSGWDWYNFMTYVQLYPETDKAALDAAAEKVLNAQFRSDSLDQTRHVAIFYPAQDIHLYSQAEGELSASGNAKNVSFFALIAILILLIAWINYINLSTARSMERAREIGVRKAIGAYSGQVRRQFLFESLFINILAALLAVGITYVCLPYLSDLIGKDITAAYQASNNFWLWFIAAVFIGAIVAGFYPALVLAQTRTVDVLKGNSKKKGKGVNLRKALVVVQFAASVALIAGTLAVYKQTIFIQKQDLGMDLEQIIVVKGPKIFTEDDDKKERLNTFKKELRDLPSVVDAAAAGDVPGGSFDFGTGIRSVEQSPNVRNEVQIVWVDNHFTDTYGMKLLAGEKFSEDFKRGGPLVNEALLSACELGTPEEAMQKKLYVNGDTVEIFGVLEDYSWYSMRQEHNPFILLPSTRVSRKICVRVRTENMEQSLAAIQAKYEQFFPNNPFDYFFQDAFYARQYREDQRFGSVFGLFTGFALFVACLGLLGLASFNASLRIKEIGIRKVLGASLSQLLVLLTKDFLVLVCIALIIGLPVAWYATQAWLEAFPFRIEIGWWFFVLPAVLVLLIAWLTILIKTIRTASLNPVRALRYE